jgi:hypothetical protein
MRIFLFLLLRFDLIRICLTFNFSFFHTYKYFLEVLLVSIHNLPIVEDSYSEHQTHSFHFAKVQADEHRDEVGEPVDPEVDVDDKHEGEH